MEKQNQINSKLNNPIVVSVIAYLSFMGWLVAALLLNNPRQELCSFHIRQALGLNLLLVASSMAMIVPLVGWIAGIAGYVITIYFWVVGIVAASRGEEVEVPFMGREFQAWFQGL